MSSDIHAVAYGHAVSDLGYEVKVGKEELVYKDGERHITWAFKQAKDKSLAIKSDSIVVKRHGAGAAKPAQLEGREAQVIPQIVQKALQVLKIKGAFV